MLHLRLGCKNCDFECFAGTPATSLASSNEVEFFWWTVMINFNTVNLIKILAFVINAFFVLFNFCLPQCYEDIGLCFLVKFCFIMNI